MGWRFEEIWDEVARRNNLNRTESEQLSGVRNNLRVLLLTSVHQYIGYVTVAERYARVFVCARFNAHLPDGLHIRSRSHTSTSLIAHATAPEIRVGLADHDRTWRINGNDARHARDFLCIGSVGKNIARFLKRHQSALLSADGATVAIDQWNADARSLQAVLDDVVGLVSVIEADLRWSPARAAPFRPTRRHRFAPPGFAGSGGAAGDGPVEATAADSTNPLSAADAMVAALAAEGTAIDAGRFTVDRETARRKLKESGVAASGRYVLELIQAAVLKGARRIDITEDQRCVRLVWTGRPFTMTDCEQLYTTLFAEAGDDDIAARQHLAFGLHQAMAYEERGVDLLSGDGQRAVKLSLDPAEPDGYASLPAGDDAVPRWTEISVQRRLVKLHTSLDAMLRQGCGSSKTQITLDGRQISTDGPAEEVCARVALESDRIQGWCGFSQRAAPGSEISVVKNDVCIATVTGLSDATPGLVARVESPRFQVDLSRSRVVQDETYGEAVEAVYQAERRALASLGKALQAGDTSLPGTFAEPVLKARLRSYNHVAELRSGGDGEPLANVPLWHTIINTRTSLAILLNQADRLGYIPYADYTLDRIGLAQHRAREAGWAPESILLLNWYTYASDAAFLVHLFSHRLRSASAQLIALRTSF